MAEQFFKEEIECYLQCNQIEATQKQILQAVDGLMNDEDFWESLDLCMIDAMRRAKIKI